MKTNETRSAKSEKGKITGVGPLRTSNSSRPALLGRWLLGGVFVIAGAIKILDPKAFARAIVDYQLLPDWVVPAVAVILPWWEVVAGGLAIAGRWRLGALTVLVGLTAVFLGIGGFTLGRGLSPACGCFGLPGERVGPVSLSIELALLVLGGWLGWHELRRGPLSAGTREGAG